MNEPFTDSDDPRLTAYALGEADEADRQAVEAFLAESAEGRNEVEQTRKIAEALATEYAREQGSYLASRSDGELPSNVVAFKNVPARPWRRRAVWMLKAAAVAAITTTLTYLTIHRTHRSEVAVAASSPSRQLDLADTPSLVAADQFPKDKTLPPREYENSEPGQSTAAEGVHPEVAAAAIQTTPMGDVASAPQPMARVDDSDRMAETASGGRSSGTLAKTETARRSDENYASKLVPGAVRPAVLAAPEPAKPSSLEQRIGRSVVRIRTASGKFLAGVIVSDDGLILAVTSLPENLLRGPCTVFLADQRELRSVMKPTGANAGWYWLWIDSKGLLAAKTAHDPPASGVLLAVVSVDPQTGTTTFPNASGVDAIQARREVRGQLENSLQATGGASFAFNAAGELLVIDQTVQKVPSAEQARTRADQPASRKPLARPFTSAERALMQDAAKRSRHQ